MLLNTIAILLSGVLVGSIASMITGRKTFTNVLTSMVVGIWGALLGGFLARSVLPLAGQPAVAGVGLYIIVLAGLSAAVLLLIFHVFCWIQQKVD
ncbi:MAG: hypothetical protein M5U01_32590 [Ardenticatenaceae bacterium]|nr:hypothetical protein [Ardenticatenaceae bacterium]HBY92420.1 hypothetical protein [Chloroflexota bacterium]